MLKIALCSTVVSLSLGCAASSVPTMATADDVSASPSLAPAEVTYVLAVEGGNPWYYNTWDECFQLHGVRCEKRPEAFPTQEQCDAFDPRDQSYCRDLAADHRRVWRGSDRFCGALGDKLKKMGCHVPKEWANIPSRDDMSSHVCTQWLPPRDESTTLLYTTCMNGGS